jgi:hypothetical protein
MQTDLHDAFKQIFDERPRDKNVSIENFLKEIANHPETMGKKLTKLKGKLQTRISVWRN